MSSMAMDEEQLLQQRRWIMQLQIGEEITVIPSENEPVLITDVFLVDRDSAAGQGVVAACVEMGSRNIMLAQLSSEKTDVELQTPVLLDEEFCLYVMRPGGDSDADTGSDEDAVVVQFEGFVLLPDEESDEENKEDEETMSSEDDDERIDEESEEEDEEDKDEESEQEDEEDDEDDDESSDEEDEESDGEVDRDVARTTTPRGNAKDVQNFRKIAARTFLGLFLFNYMIAVFRLVM